MNAKLKSGIFQILFVNIINLFISLSTNLLLPKYLSVETYAAIKTYQLYISYIGILHFGYADGLYLKYGGKNKQEINPEQFEREIVTFHGFQMVVAALIAVYSIVLKNRMMLIVALSILPYNTFVCYRSVMQAAGEFKEYSKITNFNTVFIFAVNIIGIVVLATDNAYIYLIGYLVSYILIWLSTEKIGKQICGKDVKWRIGFDRKIFVDNIKSGILLMLGTFSSIVLTGMDRWFVKVLMNTLEFAQYSFAVSIEGLINFAVTPITTTLYNYFCTEKNESQIKKIRNSVMIFSAALVTCAFPAKFILEIFLTKYIDAAGVMFYLFAAQIFFIIVKSVYVNLYKAEKRQKEYFIKLVIVILAGAMLNALLYWIWKSKDAFALGTLLSAVIWFFLCQYDFRQIKMCANEYIYLTLITAVYLLTGYKLSAITGFGCYFFLFCILSVVLLPNEFLGMLKSIWSIKNTLLVKLKENKKSE